MVGSLSGRAWSAVLIGGLGLVGAYLVLPGTAWKDVAYDVWMTVAALLVVVGLLVHRPAKRGPWLARALGLGLTAAGDWTWSILDAMGEEPFPSIADVFYLTGMALIAVAIWTDGRGRVPGGDRAAVLDALILSAGFAMVSWLVVIKPIAAAASASVVETSVALAYPSIDIALLAVTARVLMGSGSRAPTSRLLVLAVAAYLVADLVFAMVDLDGSYATGHLVDAGWLIGALCFAVAALHPSMGQVSAPVPADVGRLTVGRLTALTAASLTAPLLLMVQAWQGVEIDALVIAAGSIALFLLVIGRLLVVLFDLRRVLRERQRLEIALRRQASEDALTGLANRAIFSDRLAYALSIPGEPVGVIFVDLDDFKGINDTLGHPAGDALLREVASRFRSVVRPADTPARLGGDEFGILLRESLDRRSAVAVAERLLEAVARPVVVDGHPTMTVTASAGVALGSGGSLTAESLMQRADIAMYRAKAAGKGACVVYDEATETVSAARPAAPGRRIDRPRPVGQPS